MENFFLLIILLIFSLETIMFVLKISFPADNSLFINSGGEDVYYGKDHYHNDTSISSFNLSPSDDWAYSYAGDYLTRNFNASASVINSTCEFTSSKANIDNNFRLAPVSITYYGLCLRKGEYIVTLYFAEALYSKSEDYSTSGKRVFDIYIQVSINLSESLFMY
jgi:interleukin-1 receptor-associated kinase 1